MLMGAQWRAAEPPPRRSAPGCARTGGAAQSCPPAGRAGPRAAHCPPPLDSRSAIAMHARDRARAPARAAIGRARAVAGRWADASSANRGRAAARRRGAAGGGLQRAAPGRQRLRPSVPAPYTRAARRGRRERAYYGASSWQNKNSGRAPLCRSLVVSLRPVARSARGTLRGGAADWAAAGRSRRAPLARQAHLGGVRLGAAAAA